MRYTVLGKTGLRVSALGFGCMRLPMKNNRVDRELSTPMLRRAIELGVNFFDTAVMYCQGDSQAALGEAMEGRRDKVVLSTKNQLRDVTPAAWRAKLEESLRLMRTDHLDLYHHHGMTWNDFVKHFDPDKGGLTREMLKAKEEGLIRHAAFSFHDSPANLVKLIDTGYYESIIVQYNLLDQANADAMTHAHEKGMGVVVMGPIGGGRLGIPSERIREMTGAASTVEAALRFVWAHPAVNVALSGMESMAMLEENARIAEAHKAFAPEEVTHLNRLVRERREKSGLYCSGCRYCIPECPAGIPIPAHLDLLNLAQIFGLDDAARSRYRHVSVKASECIGCARCVAACPQKIDIPARLRDVAQNFDDRFHRALVSIAMDSVDAHGAFRMSLKTFNFAASETPLTLSIEAGGDAPAPVQPMCHSAKALAPFTRRAFAVTGKLDPRDPALAFRINIAAHGAASALDVGYRCLLLPSGAPEDWQSGTWHAAQPTPAQFTAAPETAPRHGLRFRLGRDAEALLVHAEVRDDFLYPSRADRDRGSMVDGLEFFLDGRAPARLGEPLYEKAVHQVFVYPGTPGEHPAFFHAKSGITLDVNSETMPGGYRVRIRVPFAEFCAGESSPRKFGFDLAVNTADRQGHRIGQFAFAGGPDNWKDPSLFREVWLV